LEHAFIVTDAIAAAGQGPGVYRLSGKDVVVDDHLATWSSDRSHLMGSAITMPRVADNLRRALGLSATEIERLTRLNPRQAIGLS
jgi:N-acetylglucosamine-6-phosphate deacetylase